MQKTINLFYYTLTFIIFTSLSIMLLFINIYTNTYLPFILILTIISLCCIMGIIKLWHEIIESDKRVFCIIRSIIKPKEYRKEMDSFIKGMEHYRSTRKNNEIEHLLKAYKHYKDAKKFVEINKRSMFNTCLIHTAQAKHKIHYELNKNKKVIITNSYDFQRMCLIICEQQRYDTLWTNSYYVRN